MLRIHDLDGAYLREVALPGVVSLFDADEAVRALSRADRALARVIEQVEAVRRRS